VQYIFLSHDVDWRRQGPSIGHILDRKERFEKSVLDSLKNNKITNLYYNIPLLIELEEKFGVRSTFFFRTMYENGSYVDYSDDIRILIRGGWEIGLHSDPTSINARKRILDEKIKLEKLTKTPVRAHRVHYLGFNRDLPKMLQELGFVYDSSVRKSKDRIGIEEVGYFKFDKLIEFPITIMDAYLFTYMKIKENQIISIVEKTLNYCRSLDDKFNIMTILWHDNVLRMKGGRMYSQILQYLSSQEDIQICKGLELVEKINSNVD
jgi:peptidoglycan/xylan/chitin deacetylase (PgdA/CDA1 family)